MCSGAITVCDSSSTWSSHALRLMYHQACNKSVESCSKVCYTVLLVGRQALCLTVGSPLLATAALHRFGTNVMHTFVMGGSLVVCRPPVLPFLPSTGILSTSVQATCC